jgi:regulator of protease activity HflC (stomatin/prohibitin superfamily)
MSDLLVWAIVLIVAVVLISILAAAIKILREWERGVILRLGRLQPLKGPGLILIIPVIDRLYRVDQRVITLDVPQQRIITRDNVSVEVDAVVFYRVIDQVFCPGNLRKEVRCYTKVSRKGLEPITR